MTAVHEARDRLSASLPAALMYLQPGLQTTHVMARFTSSAADALADRLTKGDEAIAAVERVRDMHTGLHRCMHGDWWSDGDPLYRGTIAHRGPCPTKSALDGGAS